MRKTPATLAILFAAASLIHGADPTAVLTAPVKIPIVSNGREVGTQTAVTGSIVTVLQKDPVTGKSLVRTSLGETWVDPGCIQSSNQEGTTSTVAVPRQKATQPPAPASTPGLTGIPRPKEPEPSEKFTISVGGADVEVRRFGRGEKGVVFFNNSGPMDGEITRSISEYAPLLAKGCSLFLWGYPKAKPFDGVQTAIGSWMGGGNGRVEFPGVAAAVAEGIRKKTGLKKLLFVGNSLGGGVLLWDYPKLSENADNQFLLISPTEMFMPDPATLKPMKRGVLIADEKADPFVKSQVLKSWIASNKSALMDKVAARGHIIVGGDGFSHKELAELIGLSFDQH